MKTFDNKRTTIRPNCRPFLNLILLLALYHPYVLRQRNVLPPVEKLKPTGVDEVCLVRVDLGVDVVGSDEDAVSCSVGKVLLDEHLSWVGRDTSSRVERFLPLAIDSGKDAWVIPLDWRNARIRGA